MTDVITWLITWTTYGTWLPGDSRGWRRRQSGSQLPEPLLEQWCRKQMAGEAVLLKPHDRDTVEDACREHCKVRGWHLFAVNARTNHVHVVVAADPKPGKIRNQLKANCTGRLRTQENPLNVAKTWTRGGDCEILEDDTQIEAAVLYVQEAQDRMGIGNRADGASRG